MRRAGVVMAMASAISRERIPPAAAEAAMREAERLLIPTRAELLCHFRATAPEHADEIADAVAAFYREHLA